MAVALPPELIDEIFCVLKGNALTRGPKRKEYVKTIQHCLFVSKPFRHRALQILFQHIRISNYSPKIGPKHLAVLRQIISPPELNLEGVGRYVESVSISFKPLPEISIFSRPSKHLEDLKNFLGDENLVAVINGLHGEDYGIKDLDVNLVMSRSGRASCGTKWDEIDPRFCAALAALVQSPQLNYLWISDIHHVPLTLLNNSHIQYLRLHHSILGQPISYFSHPAQELPYPIMEAVFYNGAASQLQKVPNGPFQRLTEFDSLSHGQEQMREAWRIISAASETLESISIVHYGVVALPPLPFSLSNIPHLASFSYCQRHVPFLDDSSAALDLERVYSLLDVKAPMKRLQIMNLEFQCHKTDVHITTVHPAVISQWMQFDSLLAGPDYASLRKINLEVLIVLILEYSDEIDSQWLVESVKRQLCLCFEHLGRSKAEFGIVVDVD